MQLTATVRTFIALAITAGFIAPSARADWKPGEGMAASMALNIALGTTMEQASDLGFYDTCYLGTYMRPGNNSWLRTYLQAGTKYVFLGAVGNDADLDITVENSDGRIVAKDTQTDNLPIVQFTPRTSGEYTIRLKLYSAPSSLFCGMVLLQEGGWSLPINNLAQATADMLRSCNGVADQISARFLQEPGEWAVMGQVLRDGQTGGYSKMTLGTGRRFVVSGCDHHGRDTDLRVREDNGRGMLDEDTLSDNRPILDFRSRSGKDYGLEIINADSSGATIVMAAILDAN